MPSAVIPRLMSQCGPAFRSVSCFALVGVVIMAIACDETSQSPTAPPPPTPIPAQPPGLIPGEIHSFTDSTGRTILYKLEFEAEWDLSQPRGVELYFHGNNTGTERDVLRQSGWPREPSRKNGMLQVSVASPGLYLPAGIVTRFAKAGTRSWYTEDARTVHELLQSDFGGQAAIDRDQIVFTGGSQGPCFINYFLNRYAQVYGGGFHSWCGCLLWGNAWPPRGTNPWSPTVPWTPHVASQAARRFRVFVQATTEDFLHKQALFMRHYYQDVLGFPTRSDLNAAGGHCAPGAVSYSSIFEWLTEKAPVPRGAAVPGDDDGDGIANAVDLDDDNDGAPDIVDALPHDAREWLDTDGDGVGNAFDRDADGDGVENAVDPFSLDRLEWIDNDEDGIGDNQDIDDDNDNIPDTRDPDPLSGPPIDHLGFDTGRVPLRSIFAIVKLAQLHARRPAAINYPETLGNRQTYGFIALGDSDDPVFEIMVDSLETSERCETVLLPELCRNDHLQGDVIEEGYGLFHATRLHGIHIDRNQNRDLRDDGPPVVMMDNPMDTGGTIGRASLAPGVRVVLHVPYRTGEHLPYGIKLTVLDNPESGVIQLGYDVASFWSGHLSVPGGEPLIAVTFDANLDGRFDSGTLGVEEAFKVRVEQQGDRLVRSWSSVPAAGDRLRDYACLDLDRDGVLSECDNVIPRDGTLAPIYAGEPFKLDGRTCRIEVETTGHRARIDC